MDTHNNVASTSGVETNWTDPSHDKEVTAEEWENALDVLPPLAMSHDYFYGSEPLYHDENGRMVVTYGYVKQGRYYLGSRAYSGKKPQHT